MSKKDSKLEERIDLEVIKNSEVLYKQLALFTDGKPWDEKRYWKNARMHMESAMYHLIQAGKCLIVLEKMLGKEEFKRKCNLELGMHPKTAYNYIAITEWALTADLPEKLINKSKKYHLLQLSALPEKFQEEMKTQKTLNGKPLDDVLTFSKKELEEYIRSITLEAEEKLRLKEEELDKKNREIEKLNIDKKILEIELSKVRGEIPKEFSKSVAMMDAILAQMERLRKTLIEQKPTPDELAILQDHVETLRLLLSHIEPLVRPNSLMANPKFYDPVKTDVEMQRINSDSRFDFSKLDSEEISED